jgi:hypothetical protein
LVTEEFAPVVVVSPLRLAGLRVMEGREEEDDSLIAPPISSP